MTPIDLLSPPGSAPALQRWLAQIADFLTGYQRLALVTRCTLDYANEEQGIVREVQRWSHVSLLRLDAGLNGLWLDPWGRLWQSEPERRRWIRQGPAIQIFDDICRIQLAARPTALQVARVLVCLMGQLGAQVWAHFEQLSPEQRSLLVQAEFSWTVLKEALEHSPDRAQQVLPLLLGPLSHPANRAALLEAGARGDYTPPASALPWLLLQVEWNLSPGVLGLTQACLQAHSQEAWQLQHHPNPVLRRRLAQLLPPDPDRSQRWLACEGDPSVRQVLTRSGERPRPLSPWNKPSLFLDPPKRLWQQLHNTLVRGTLDLLHPGNRSRGG